MNNNITKIANSCLSSFSQNTSFEIFKHLHPFIKDVNLKKFINKPISSIKSMYGDLKRVFFTYFPILNTLFTDDYSIQPSRHFFPNSAKTIPYLLKESKEVAKKEILHNLHDLKNLSCYGTLRQSEDKRVYLDIDSNFIDFSFLNITNENITKSQNKSLTIISAEEYKTREVFRIREIGHQFHFQIKGFYSITPEDENLEKIWFLEIESKELEEFRYKYHLSPRIGAHNFLIIVASIKSKKNRNSYPHMRINISYIAA